MAIDWEKYWSVIYKGDKAVMNKSSWYGEYITYFNHGDVCLSGYRAMDINSYQIVEEISEQEYNEQIEILKNKI